MQKFPPMGWNSWDCYGTSVTEELLLKNASYMARELKPFGWEYVVCDIQWYEPKARGNRYNDGAVLCMDGFSRLLPAENRFPSASGGRGFSVIAERIHAMGLKFGVHIMRGIPRCAVEGRIPIKKSPLTAADVANVNSFCSWNKDMYGINPDADGAYEYYLSVFELFTEWGVDFVKVDDISNTEAFPEEPYSAEREIELIRRAVDACGRPMVLSLSPGPAPIEKAEHLSKNADMWRLTGDFWDKWDKLRAMFDYCKSWYPYVDKGGFPDCDMLPIGRLRVHEDGTKYPYTRFSEDEQRTMLSLWCIFRSPLMLGCELFDFATPLRLLTNTEILTMHREGKSPRPVCEKGNTIVWRSEGKESIYIAVFNVGGLRKRVTLSLPELNASEYEEPMELWSGATVKCENGRLKVNVARHGAVVLKLKKR